MGEMRKISDFFNLIHQQLPRIQEHAPWADDQRVVGKLEQLKMDLGFLYMIFWYFNKPWEEQSRIRMRCTISAFRVLWDLEVKRNGLVQKSLKDTWPVDVQAFLSLAFDLEGKIQQSKLLVQQWCEYMLRSSSRLFSQEYSSLYDIENILGIYSIYRAAKKNPFKNQIDILKDKVAFMQSVSVDLDYHAFSEKIDRIKKYTRHFINNAACTAILFWAKGADEEVATALLYDMSHKFIPYALEVNTFLFSQTLMNSDNRLKIVAGFVDFFFRHLDDDFMILGDPLTLVFISLSNTPHQIVEADEEVLRTQMLSLFHDHLLSFCDMKQLLDSNNKTFLMIQFEIANDKIRQLYYARFSDSCFTLEAEKLDYIYFVSVSKQLYLIDKYSNFRRMDFWLTDSEKSQLRLYRMELRFLRVFFLCFATWDNKDIKERLSSMITHLQGIWQKEEEKKGLLVTRLHAIRRGDVADWNPLAFELKKKIKQSKLEMKASCINLFDLSFQFKPKTSHKMVQFMDSMLNILNELVTFKANEIVPFKEQIETLEDKLVFLRNFMKLTVNCIDNKELTEFKMCVQSFANDAACLIFFYWAKDAKENIPSEVNDMLSHMLQQINPVMPDNARLYFQTLKIIYLQRSDSLLFGQTALIFIENLLTPFKDDFQILHDEFIFLLTFLNDPPNKNAGEVICSHIDDSFWEDVYCLLPFDDSEGDFVKKKKIFIIKIGAINMKIKTHYIKFPDSSLYYFPRVVSPFFLDFIIQNLKNLNERMMSDRKYAPFAKYKIIKIREELVSLHPFFNYIFNLQSEQNEAWLEVVNILHLTQHIINSCISSWFVFDNPIWYHMAYLYEVIDRIKVVKTKLEKIRDNTYNLPCSTSCTPLKQARPLEITESVVGFENEAEIIIGMLTQLNMSLDIVSIVGMGGLGKTTLAKLVYGSATAKGNFDVFAFCSVSQDHNASRLLMDILRNITGDDKSISDMTKDDLAHKLWQCLSGRKYLIVLDDIWDVSPWNEVKNSFPDNKNGSRVMFTTRFQDVADKCKINCSPYRLRFMSEDESWELLQRKVFPDGISPQNFFDIGRTIAKNCNGLPLAVVVIAGLLVRTEKSLEWWNEVAEKVTSYLRDEGCMKILELSYNHLPEILKPCFLYLAAFPEDWVIEVKKVTLLWISEGFIQESETKSLDDVARDFIQDLVDRSLIIVSARSSDGGIKGFRIHDLIRDLCQTKCRDENFLLLNHEIASSSYSDPSIKNHYRVSTQNKSDVTVGSSILNTCSLLYFPKEYGAFSFPFKEFKLAQVLYLDRRCDGSNTKQLSSLVHLRHLDVCWDWAPSLEINISSWMCNFWNIGSLILKGGIMHLPEETFWRMKSLRHVEVNYFKLKFSEEQEEHEAYPKLDKVVSFSQPELSSGKDVQRLLQRLPAVRKLSCSLFNSDDEDSVETIDFPINIESLKLVGGRFLNFRFPSTLRKLTLSYIGLPLTAITALSELQFLQVLKLRYNSFPEARLEMEDMTFQNLNFFALINNELVEWNAITESLPCLEQLVIGCPRLKELPPCFLESSTLKRIVVRRCYSDDKSMESSAVGIQEALMELGIKIEVSIIK